MPAGAPLRQPVKGLDTLPIAAYGTVGVSPSSRSRRSLISDMGRREDTYQQGGLVFCPSVKHQTLSASDRHHKRFSF